MNQKNELIPYKRSRKRAQIVTVSGGKGGIGKTFFAVNFGVELKNRGFKVLIFDADINLSNVNLFLNIDENKDFEDFLQNRVPIGDIIQKGVGGVDVLYVGNNLNSILTLEKKDFNTITGGLVQVENDYDFIIIDTQAGLTELNLNLLLLSDRNILITNPEITALVDLYKVIKVAADKKSGLYFEIVINRSYGAGSAARIYEKISQTVSQFGIRTSLSFLGFITDDSRRVVESIQKRIPIVILHQSGSINECLRMIANSFLRNVRPRRKFPFFYGLLDKG
jgi:flagellar biosynthesis protein FlhG